MKSGTKSFWKPMESATRRRICRSSIRRSNGEISGELEEAFDDDIQIGSDGCYGNIWEVRREWVKNVIQ